jgi:hypothetical protein
VSAVALVAALIVLALKVRARQEVDVDQAELQRAEAQYKQRASQLQPPTPALDRAQARATSIPPPTASAADRRSPPDVVPSAGERASVDPVVTVQRTPDEQLKARMDAATRLFDRGDYPGAEDAAVSILEANPRNIRMLRIVVSSACATGSVDRAKEYYARLPSRDQEQMQRRCDKWGVQVGGPPAR